MKREPRHHEIDLAELQDWITKEEALFAESGRERKRLTCTLNGTFRVRIAGELIWQGNQPFQAVEAYNAITEKYADPLKDIRKKFTI